MSRNVSPCPTCNEKECFVNENGKCICLIDNDFGKRKCPFFKTKGEMQIQTQPKKR